jgi:hypothetical protein
MSKVSVRRPQRNSPVAQYSITDGRFACGTIEHDDAGYFAVDTDGVISGPFPTITAASRASGGIVMIGLPNRRIGTFTRHTNHRPGRRWSSFDAEVERLADERKANESPELKRLRRLADMSFDRMWSETNAPRLRPTPQATVEAVLEDVKERGVAALREPKNIERLTRCDAAAKAQIDRRIAKLGLGK